MHPMLIIWGIYAVAFLLVVINGCMVIGSMINYTKARRAEADVSTLHELAVSIAWRLLIIAIALSVICITKPALDDWNETHTTSES